MTRENTDTSTARLTFKVCDGPRELMRMNHDGSIEVKPDDIDEAMRVFRDQLRRQCGLPLSAAPIHEGEGVTVWYGKMPESNGRENWTASLHRKGGGIHTEGFCFARSEYPGRVLYEADRVRWIIGELAEKPDILAYDADTHSGYAAPPPSVEVERLREAVTANDIAAIIEDRAEVEDGLLCNAGYIAQDIYLTVTAALSRKQEPGVPTPGDWIEWSGGVNPVPGRRVDVETRGTGIWLDWLSDQWGTSWLVEEHDDLNCADAIIAFRLVEAPADKGSLQPSPSVPGEQPWPLVVALCESLRDNDDPNEPIADNGASVLDGWRDLARRILAAQPQPAVSVSPGMETLQASECTKHGEEDQ